jgi:hypothetical protein
LNGKTWIDARAAFPGCRERSPQALAEEKTVSGNRGSDMGAYPITA